MHTPVLTAKPRPSVRDIGIKLATSRIGGSPATDREGMVVGVITEEKYSEGTLTLPSGIDAEGEGIEGPQHLVKESVQASEAPTRLSAREALQRSYRSRTGRGDLWA
ncbi:MAG: hypothetical protein HYX73_10215 [Acidobacteria bacterium]|nr:hypothetical protein [Acidobacteriota bacterium]